MRDMEPISHRETALDHLEAVRHTAAHVNDLHGGPRVDRAEVAKGYDAIRQGLKIAEVHALLAVAEAIEKTTQPTAVTMRANGLTSDSPTSCICGSPGSTSLTPGEVVVHRQDQPCYVQSRVTM